MEKKFIESNRGRVYYWINTDSEECHKEKTILFCHGLTGDHTLFDRQVEQFSRDYCVITVDMPLHGESRDYSHFSFATLSKDLATILKTEGIEKTVFVGHSAGGYAAQAFTLYFPNMIAGFVSLGSNPFGSKYYSRPEKIITKNYSKIARLYPYKSYCKLSVENAACTPEGRAVFAECLSKLGRGDMLKAAKAYYGEFFRYEEVDFGCPVLLLVGEKDVTGYVKRYCKMWAEEENYPLIEIPKAAHNANCDNFRFFNKVLKEFLEKELGW